MRVTHVVSFDRNLKKIDEQKVKSSVEVEIVSVNKEVNLSEKKIEVKTKKVELKKEILNPMTQIDNTITPQNGEYVL